MQDLPTRRRFSSSLATALAGAVLFRTHPLCAEPALSDAFSRIERKTGGRLGVAILDAHTGNRYGHRADERFPMCSTFKVLACGALLARVDAGRENLDRRVRFAPNEVLHYSPLTRAHAGGDGMTLAEICRAAVTMSDNTAANLILRAIGGPAAVTAFARSLGDPVTRLDRTEPTLNDATPGDPRDTTTPAAMAADLHRLVLGNTLSPASRERLTGWMLACKTGDARLRAGLPAGWRVGDKTGSGRNGTANDIAVIWPPGRSALIACVYLTQATVPFEAQNAAIAEVGRVIGAMRA